MRPVRWPDQLAALPAADREAVIAGMSPEAIETLAHDWEMWRRPAQAPPPGDWRYWLLMAGRGVGKTRVGAETLRQWAKTCRHTTIAAATADDLREICVEGESGILAVCPNHELPTYVGWKRRLEWPNGGRTLLLSADEPKRFRGKQHQKLWCDELAWWSKEGEAWTQAKFGLRLPCPGGPQAVITTTPRPLGMLKKLINHPATVVTRGSTYDNRANLAAAFFDEIVTEYEGTALGQQELMGVYMEQAEGALWQREWLEETRVGEWPENIISMIIGVDPPGGATLCGIVAAGMTIEGGKKDLYTGCDRSIKLPPDGWARRAIDLFDELDADLIVAEKNFGGDMVGEVIKAASEAMGRLVPFRLVHASRGKSARAQPISALWEQERAHMVGMNQDLEDELCGWVPGVSGPSPNRLDAMVWAATAATKPRGVYW